MDTKYAKVFIDSWQTVLESFSSKKIMSAEVNPPKKYRYEGDINVFMGILGDINGQVVMTLDNRTGKILTSDMLGGMEITDVDELVISAVGEMCNMIMGNACLNISSESTNIDITPPTVISDNIFPQSTVKPSYSISLQLEDLEAIDFNVAIIKS